MHRLFSSLIVVGLFFISALCAPLTASAEEDGLFLVNTSIKPPLSTVEESGALDVLVRELARRVGLFAVIVRQPAERAMHSVNDGSSDAELPRVAGLEKQYPNLLMVPEKVLDYSFVAFATRPQVSVEGWDSLGQYALGIITGWKIYENNVPPESKITWASDPEQLFKLLERGRVDLVLHEHFSGGYYARRLGLADVRELAQPLAVRPMYIYVHKRHEKLVPQLEAALKAMKADGVYDRIMREATGE